MKKIVVAAMLSAVVSTPAFAGGSAKSVGVNYGLDLNGVMGIQGEMDVSSMVNKMPVSLQAFYKGYSESFTIPGLPAIPPFFAGTPSVTYKYSYTGLGAAAIYDFSSHLHLDKKIKPYAGLGLYTLSAKLSGGVTGVTLASPASGGLYFTGGVRYTLTPEIAADFNYNNIGGLTIGANYSF